jgi:hypothetical protein
VFRERLPMMHRFSWGGPIERSARELAGSEQVRPPLRFQERQAQQHVDPRHEPERELGERARQLERWGRFFSGGDQAHFQAAIRRQSGHTIG